MMSDIWVVAGNKWEFNRFLKMDDVQRVWPKEVKHGMIRYVESFEQLRCESCRVVTYGTFHQRLDWPLIEGVMGAYKHRELKIR